MADILIGALLKGAGAALSMGLNASERKGNNSMMLAQVKLYVDHIARRLTTLDRSVDTESEHRDQLDFLRARFTAAVETFEQARKTHEKSNAVMKLAKSDDVNKMLLVTRQEFAVLTKEIDDLAARVRPDCKARPPPAHHLHALPGPRAQQQHQPTRTATAPPAMMGGYFGGPGPGPGPGSAPYAANFGYPGSGGGGMPMPMPMPGSLPRPGGGAGDSSYAPQHGYPGPQMYPPPPSQGHPSPYAHSAPGTPMSTFPEQLDHPMGAMHLGTPSSGGGSGYFPSGTFAPSTEDVAKLITVAIDFGTSHTGFAFADRSMTDAELNKESLLGFIHQPQNWPDAPSPYAKTRSAIAYREDGAVYAWGNTAEAQMAAGAKDIGFYIHRVKLLLDENRAKNDKLNELLEEMQKTPVEVIADYLRELLVVIARDTEHMMGGMFDPEQVMWVLTVPAMWTVKAKNMMRQAMYTAGMIPDQLSKNLLICLEPEAALIAVSSLSSQLQVGDKILVVDSGGGTIDLSAFKMLPSTKEGGPAHFEELAPSGGILKGSTILDDNFLALFAGLIGQDLYMSLVQSNPKLRTSVLAEWELCKRSFDGTEESRPFEIKVPREIRRKMDDHHKRLITKFNARTDDDDDDEDFEEIVLDYRKLVNLYADIVQPIADLTTDMLTESQKAGHKINKIVCVGGFSDSKYLIHRLREEFQDQGRRISVVCATAPNAGAAVLYGAAIFGANPSVVNKRCVQRTFGYRFGDRYNPQRHGMDKSQLKMYTDGRGHEMVDLCFKVMVERGQGINGDDSFPSEISPPRNGLQSLPFDIYASVKTRPVFIHEAEHVAKIDIPLPYGYDHRQLRFKITLFFGQTEIRAQVTNQMTGETEEVELQYN